jgi:phthalate 4,5-dioxygenase oxygenase subunit
MRDGGPAIGTADPRIPHANIRSFEGVVSKGTDWRTCGAGTSASEQQKEERVA